MNRFIMKTVVFLFAITLWQTGIFEAAAPGIGGNVSIAEASHRGGGGGGGSRFCQRFPDRCKAFCRRFPSRCQPPTVSELPIQYMVLSGVAIIALSGGMVFFIRKRRMKSSLEA